MRLLLFGATGMLGQALTKEATKRSLDVIGVARIGADICADITNDAVIGNLIAEIKPDIIVNAAAMINLKDCEKNPELAYRINSRSVGILSNFAKQHRSYFVQISTDHYYTGDFSMKHNEFSAVELVNEYARTKYAGEAFALTNYDAMVVRTNIVGFRRKHDSPTFIEWVVDALANNKPLTMFDDFFTSSIDVKSFSRILLDLIKLKYAGLINIGSKDVITKKMFIEKIAWRMGFDLSNSNIGSVRNNADGIFRAESLGLDVSLAEKLLQYPMPNSDAVADQLVLENNEGDAS